MVLDRVQIATPGCSEQGRSQYFQEECEYRQLIIGGCSRIFFIFSAVCEIKYQAGSERQSADIYKENHFNIKSTCCQNVNKNGRKNILIMQYIFT